MATFDATLSGANATSYISVERATALTTDTPQAAAWAAMTEGEQKIALNAATGWLETLTYGGSRCGIPSADDPTKPQSLQWPRSGITCNGYTAACDLIPYKLEWAEVLLAVQLHANPDAIIPPGGGGSTQAGVFVSMQKLGDLEQQFTEYSNPQSNSCDSCGDPPLLQAFPWLRSILGCWYEGDGLVNGSGLMLRVRS